MKCEVLEVFTARERLVSQSGGSEWFGQLVCWFMLSHCSSGVSIPYNALSVSVGALWVYADSTCEFCIFLGIGKYGVKDVL